jgi:hypothetical protein
MPYESKAEKERALWMTRPEAIAHICSADGCKKAAARRQYANFIADNPSVLRREPIPMGSMPASYLPPLFKPRMVLRSMVESTWPLPPASNAPPAAGPAESEAAPRPRAYSSEALRRWHLELVQEHTEAGTIPTEAEEWAKAKVEVSRDVPRDAVRKLRQDSNLTPETWRKRGPRSKIGRGD